ncbi:uncharacterized protein L201_001202 [Kwoniella dendrophila CBS 6074]|uniref:C2H2-type domain-containing protein n=1 Tax=Kwoniella dendrophila CBS 6074 TaxID=1295534 RepID=A0AAX4JN60_9TREE
MNRYEPYPRTISSSSSSEYIQYGQPSINARPAPSQWKRPFQSYEVKQNPSLKTKSIKLQPSNSSRSRYQLSRGAQRDAKYDKKEAQKAESRIKAKSQHIMLPPQPPPHLLQPVHPAYRQYSKETYYQQQPFELDKGSSRPPFIVPIASNRRDQQDARERMRQNQILVIEGAGSAHQRSTKIAAVRVRYPHDEKRIKSIQLQVFVRAKPTHCEWKDCQAILNSWASLEKHIHHCHLHPKYTAPGPISCQWQGCDQVFPNRGDCEHHVLVNHMAPYCARCPFNCEYEGSNFELLMAHIDRRHPHCTRDDFVPGLIHQKPNLPPLSTLPPLPCLNDKPDKYHPLVDEIKPWSGGIDKRNRRMVIARCMKRKNPTGVDAFVDKKGAGAAIKVIIENARRLNTVSSNSSSALRNIVENDLLFANDEDKDNIHVPDSEGMPLNKTTIELVDVLGSAKLAAEEARKDLDIRSDYTDQSSNYGISSSTSGEISPASVLSFSTSEVGSSLSRPCSVDPKENHRQNPMVNKRKGSERLRLKLERSNSTSSYVDSLYSEES